MELEKQKEFGNKLKTLCDEYNVTLQPQVVISNAGFQCSILMSDKPDAKPEVVKDEKATPEPDKPTTPTEAPKA